MKKKTVKPTPKQMRIIRQYWKKYLQLESDFHGNVGILEGFMQEAVGINDIEFFHGSDGYCGIGNADRTMKLWQPKR